MGRFYGEVAYYEQHETSPGVWQETPDIRMYYGDSRQIRRREQSTTTLNDNFVVDNVISIVADPFAYEKFSKIRWVKWMGQRWKVSNVTVERPRLMLTLGAVWNEQVKEVGAP